MSVEFEIAGNDFAQFPKIPVCRISAHLNEFVLFFTELKAVGNFLPPFSKSMC